MIPIPVSLKEFWDVFLDLAKKWRQRHAEGKFRHAKLGRQSPLLADVLSELYPTFERPWADRRYPVILFRVPESQITKPESILGSLADEVVVPDRSLRQAGDEYLDDLRTVGHSLITNNGTYVLKAMNANEIVNLDCAHGTYFDALATCDLLEWELLSTLGKTKARSVASVVNQLKWRSYVHYLSHEPTTCPIGRSAAIAVSTTILFRRTNDYAVLVQRRSDKGVAVHGDFLHVAPSFMFQPVVGEWTKEYSVVHNIYREYLEELFSVKEASVAPSVMAVDYFYGNPNLKFLRSLIDAGDAVLLLTGLAVNLLNLRPEICTLLHISSPKWYEKHSRGIDGLSRLQLNEEFQATDLGAKPLGWVKKGCPLPEETVPPGAAAMYLAVTTAEQMGLVPRSTSA